MKGRQFLATTLAIALASALVNAESPLTTIPKGVGPEFAKYYKQRTTFTCILNPTIKLSFDQVNDDYCDCPDGSDEPGTSACSHVSLHSVSPTNPSLNHTAALPGFYCKNQGHIPAYLPFTLVNDGICDTDLCCDGSDESKSCEDKCKDIGTEWRKTAEVKAKTRMAALKQRDLLLVEAQKARRELEDSLKNLQILLESDNTQIIVAENALVELEKQEKLKVVKAPKKGGKLGMLSSLAKSRIGQLKSGLQAINEQKDTFETRLNQLHDILQKFKQEYNPNFNDEGVKRAVRAWEDYIGALPNDADESNLNDAVATILQNDSEHGIVWADYEGNDNESEISLLYNLEQYLPQSLRDWITIKIAEIRQVLIENGLLAHQDPAGGSQESKALQEARSQLSSLKSQRSKREAEIKAANQDLDLQNNKYGPDEIFRALEGQCVENTSGEYNYEVCFMRSTTQKSKTGGMNTVMGNFNQITYITVDEEEPADGKGLGSGQRLALKYENGAQCWNGPARSTTVILACAEKTEIWKVVEAEKCIYRIECGSPAACLPDEAGHSTGESTVKDEL